MKVDGCTMYMQYHAVFMHIHMSLYATVCIHAFGFWIAQVPAPICAVYACFSGCWPIMSLFLVSTQAVIEKELSRIGTGLLFQHLCAMGLP